MKEEITNIIRTAEAVGPILGNALKSGQLFNPQCELTEPNPDIFCQISTGSRFNLIPSRDERRPSIFQRLPARQ